MSLVLSMPVYGLQGPKIIKQLRFQNGSEMKDDGSGMESDEFREVRDGFSEVVCTKDIVYI